MPGGWTTHSREVLVKVLKGVLSGEVNICFEKKINPQTVFFPLYEHIQYGKGERKRTGSLGLGSGSKVSPGIPFSSSASAKPELLPPSHSQGIFTVACLLARL